MLRTVAGLSNLSGDPLWSFSLLDEAEPRRLNMCPAMALGPTNSIFSGVSGRPTWWCVTASGWWKWRLMQSSTRAMRPVATMTLCGLLEGLRCSCLCSWDLLSNVGECLQDAVVADPHGTWRHPSASHDFGFDLAGRSHLRDNVGNNVSVISVEVI